MNQDFDYMREMDPRAKDYYVVYPRVKLWHVLAVVLTGLVITHYMLQPEMVLSTTVVLVRLCMHTLVIQQCNLLDRPKWVLQPKKNCRVKNYYEVLTEVRW